MGEKPVEAVTRRDIEHRHASQMGMVEAPRTVCVVLEDGKWIEGVPATIQRVGDRNNNL